MNFAYDPTCNLKCKSCRQDYICLQGENLEKARKIEERILEDRFNIVLEIDITGFGDAFASSLYREFLTTLEGKKYPRLEINLITNGLLLTPAMWNKIEKIHDNIHWILISIDAATAETYKLNRGGN